MLVCSKTRQNWRVFFWFNWEGNLNPSKRLAPSRLPEQSVIGRRRRVSTQVAVSIRKLEHSVVGRIGSEQCNPTRHQVGGALDIVCPIWNSVNACHRNTVANGDPFNLPGD